MVANEQQTKKRTILFFAEDAGAANFIAPLTKQLTTKTIKCTVVSQGSASRIFSHHQVLYHSPRSDDTAAEIIDRHDPDLLVVGTCENPNTTGLKLIDEAKHRYLPSIGVIDGPAFPAYRFRGCSKIPLQHVPDWILVADMPTAKIYTDLGIPSNRIKVSGQPHFDYVLDRAKTLSLKDRTELSKYILGDDILPRPVVVFIAEVSDGFEKKHFQKSTDFLLEGRGISRERTKIVLEEVLDALRQSDLNPFVVLRLAPKNRAEEFQSYRKEIDLIHEKEPVIPLLFIADLVIGMTSMPLYEAAVIGRPTLSVLPILQQRHWLSSIDLGLTRLATTRHEIGCQIKAAIETGPLATIADLGNEIFPLGASQRAGDFLNKLLMNTGKRT